MELFIFALGIAKARNVNFINCALALKNDGKKCRS